MLYIFYLQMPQRQRFPCTICEKSYCQKGKLYEDLYTLHTDYFTSKKQLLSTQQQAYQSILSYFLLLFRLRHSDMLGEF